MLSAPWSVCASAKIAKGETLNYWAGTHQATSGPIFVAASNIEDYWRQQLKVDGRMALLFGPALFTYNGKSYLNSGINRRVHTTVDPEMWGLPMMEIPYKSLCGFDENATMDQMMAELGTGSMFDWVMQWWSNIYLYPGRKPQTSLWRVGDYGFGKSTLVAAMQRVIC
jgi:hypothetical protein